MSSEDDMEERRSICKTLSLDADRPGLFNKSEIDAAYRKAALANHPDRGGSSEKFQAVAAAKEYLEHELETGRRTTATIDGRDPNGDADGASPSPVYHCWAGAMYDKPSTESPLSPLRQMGKPISVEDMPPEEMVKLWMTRNVQCVWMCQECSAVCCRVRRDKFKCVCGHALKYHDPSNGFRCTCQAVKRGKGMEQAVAKGPCRCSRFTFLVSHGMWVTKCKCKHDHVDHDPGNGFRCRKCCVSEVDGCGGDGCDGWEPAWQCHCGHGCASHSTEFVLGFLGEGHRDWVVSGVRLECARLAEKFRSRPLHEQVKRRAAAGLDANNLFTCADIWQQQREQKQRGQRMRQRREQWRRQHQEWREREQQMRDEATAGGGDENRSTGGNAGLDDSDRETREQPEAPEESKKERAVAPPTSSAPPPPPPPPDFFERHRQDVAERAARRAEHQDRILRERSLRAPFQPKTNHKSTWKRREQFYADTHKNTSTGSPRDDGSNEVADSSSSSSGGGDCLSSDGESRSSRLSFTANEVVLEAVDDNKGDEEANTGDDVGYIKSTGREREGSQEQQREEAARPPAPKPKFKRDKMKLRTAAVVAAAVATNPTKKKKAPPRPQGNGKAVVAPTSTSSYLDLVKRVTGTKKPSKKPPPPPPPPPASPAALPGNKGEGGGNEAAGEEGEEEKVDEVDEPREEKEKMEEHKEGTEPDVSTHLNSSGHHFSGEGEGGGMKETPVRELRPPPGSHRGLLDPAAELRGWLRTANLGDAVEALLVEGAGGETVDDLLLLDDDDFEELGVPMDVRRKISLALQTRDQVSGTPKGTPLDSPVGTPVRKRKSEMSAF